MVNEGFCMSLMGVMGCGESNRYPWCGIGHLIRRILALPTFHARPGVGGVVKGMFLCEFNGG